MNFSYLHSNVIHTDYSEDYMNNLGLSDEIKESVLSQFEQYGLNIVNTEQDWVINQLYIADIEISKHLDGDVRAAATVEDWRKYRKDLRDYVKRVDNVLTAIGNRPANPLS